MPQRPHGSSKPPDRILLSLLLALAVAAVAVGLLNREGRRGKGEEGNGAVSPLFPVSPLPSPVLRPAPPGTHAARRGSRPVTETRALLGTWVTITVGAPDEASGRAHLSAAFARIAELEQTLSAHRPNSELVRVNASAAREAVAVSEDLFAPVRAGVEWHRRSHGAFDITVAPLLDHWRACAKANRLPTAAEIARLRPLVDAGRIALDPAHRAIRFPVEGMRVDLGGIGKGYCADEAAKVLKAGGVASALVAVAGDIHALGRRPDGRRWRVGIQDPRRPDSPTALLATLELAQMAVSTSGNYQRFVEIQGRRYSHIVDPRTGMTADAVPSVTVIGPDALTTDIMGTALSVLGVGDGMALVESMANVEAMFVTFDDKDAPQFARSSGFAAYESAGSAGRSD